MNLLQLVLVLRARYRVVLVVALGTIAAVVAGSMLVTKRYSAETSVMVDIRSPDPVAAVLLPAIMNPGSLGMQAEIITSSRTAGKVIKMLNLDRSPVVKQQWIDATDGKGKLEDWLGELLEKSLKVTPSVQSNIIKIAYTGADPGFAAAVANAYAQAYIEAAIELKVEPARQYARWFGDQAKILRENVEKAQARLTDYQQQKGIVATEEAVDYELTKLGDLTARLTAVQAETRDAQSRQISGGAALESLPEVQQNVVVSGLRTEVARLEGKLKEAAVNLGVNHPQYQRTASELAELKNRLEAETRLVRNGLTSSYSSVRSVGRTREAELQAAIEAQKKKLLELKRARVEVAVLVRDVDTAKKAYEAVTNRFNQTSLESQATQTNVTVLSPAVEPLEPSFPKPLPTTLLIAIALGILLGLLSVFALEMVDQRVRSPNDLAEMLQLPVLGVIVTARRPNRLAFWRRGTALTVR